MLVWCVRLYVDFVPCLSFATLDPTVDEFEEEYFEDFEDNQGQATQGKPTLGPKSVLACQKAARVCHVDKPS
jgi:hypothetical protein